MHVLLSRGPFSAGAGADGSGEFTWKETTEADEKGVKTNMQKKKPNNKKIPSGRNCIEIAGWVGAGDSSG